MNSKLLDEWIAENGGVEGLAVESGVSPYTIMKIRNRIRPLVPKKSKTLAMLAKAMGVSVNDLFPPGGTGKEEAS